MIKGWRKGPPRCCKVKNPPINAGDAGSNPGSGRSLGSGNDNQLQYSCLENSMDRGAWWATVHGVSMSQIQLSTDTHYGSRKGYSDSVPLQSSVRGIPPSCVKKQKKNPALLFSIEEGLA